MRKKYILVDNDARLILRRKLNGGNDTMESKVKAKLQPWTAVSALLADQIFYRSYVKQAAFIFAVLFASSC